MKTFVPSGPEIPFEVLRAHEDGRLVFFCGAGISYYTGLPGFEGLVKDAFEKCGVPLAEMKKDAKEPWDTAFHENQFDRALQILEKEVGTTVMRDKIMDRLTIPVTDPLIIHGALLNLAKTKNGGCRLITTNFDDRFELAAPPGLTAIQSAPRLGPPRIESWRHLTYLHGRIDRKSDPKGRDLVLTSGDFGRAYLRDGWAARFIVELFREYTVLFVGYSLNDPIVSYLIDALAADMRHDGQFRNAYVLANHPPTDSGRLNAEKDWRAKGVEPIPFIANKRWKDEFKLLNNTLIEWARLDGGGLGSRVASAIQVTSNPYVPGGLKEEIRNVAWALSKRDGSVAREFADFTPSPRIEWLTPLSEIELPSDELGTLPIQLFDLPSPRPRKDGIKGHHLAPLAGDGATCIPSLNIHPVTFHLGRWLAKHMDTDEVMNWVGQRQGIIHPAWAHPLSVGLKSVTDPKICKFWRHILNGDTRPPCPPPAHFAGDALELGRGPLTPETASLLPTCAGAYLSPKEYLNWGSFDLRIVDASTLRRVLKRADGDVTKATLADLSDDLTSCLARAMVLAETAGITLTSNHSYMAIKSINPNRRNTSRQDWTVLVELTRAEFEAAIEHQPNLAKSVLERWRTLWIVSNLHIFKRLFVHAQTVWTQLPATQGLEFICETDGNVLWAHDAWREVARFIRLRARELTQPEQTRLIEQILMGPQRTQEDGDIEVFERWKSSVIRQRLGKLLQAGIALPAENQELANEYLQAWGDEALNERSDELGGPPSVARWVPPATADHLLELTSEEIATEILRDQDSWSAGHKLKDLALQKPFKALRVIRSLIAAADDRRDVWDIGLSGFIPRNEKYPRKIIIRRLGRFFQTYGDWFSIRGHRPFGELLKKFAPLLQEGEEAESEFWTNWDLAWEAAKADGDSNLVDHDEDYEAAINAPGGRLAEALLDRLWARGPHAGSGLPDELTPYFTQLVDGDTLSHRFGRILLASRLFWLHAIDDDWARDNLINRMDLELPESKGLWQGFLWSAHWSPDLISEMKTSFVEQSANLADVDDDTANQFASFFADILLVSPKTLTKQDTREIFSGLRDSELAHVAWHFQIRLKTAGEKAASLWRETLAPIFKNFWPAVLEKKSDRTSKAYADMLLSTREAFPEALEVLRNKELITKARQPDLILALDREIGRAQDQAKVADGESAAPYDCLTKHPEEVLILISESVADQPELWILQHLVTILDEISNINLQLTETAAYQRLHQIANAG